MDCATAPLPAPPLDYSAAGSFNQWANAASLLAALGRNSEALSATDSALAIFPDSPFVHWLRGNILYAMGNRSEAEQEYLAAISLEPSEVTWTALANFYQQEGRIPRPSTPGNKQAGCRPGQTWCRSKLGVILSAYPAAQADLAGTR